MANIRIVGGPSAGDEISLDLEKTGSIFRVPTHPDFLHCSECAPDGVEEHWTYYRVFKVPYLTGHRHFYAVPVEWQDVAALNDMWHSYKMQRINP